jgi:hypothetical protein
MKAADERILQFSVSGEDPLDATNPLFANFVGVSHAGTEVQFEFVFMDLNQIAQTAQKIQSGGHKAPEKLEFKGKTVAKVIVPVAVFIQLKDHLNAMLQKLEGIANAAQQEETQERRSASR